MRELLQRLHSIKAEVLATADLSQTCLASIAASTLIIPDNLAHNGILPADVYTLIPCIVPMQLLAAHLAELKGLDPDNPRTLTKVTRTV